MNKLPIVVIGFGGHGHVVAAALIAAGEQIIAATDLSHCGGKDRELAIELINDETLIQEYAPDALRLALGIGSIWPAAKDDVRHKVVDNLTARGFRFVGLTHPFSWIASSSISTIATTAQVHAGVVIQPGVTVGDYSIVNTRVAIDHDCQVGEFCHLAPGVTLSGNVIVGDGSHLGTGCTVIQGVRIGAGCMVAAGATVVKDVADGQWVRGTPAHVFEPKQRQA